MKKKGEWIVKVVTKWRLYGAWLRNKLETNQEVFGSTELPIGSTSQAAQHSHCLLPLLSIF